MFYVEEFTRFAMICFLCFKSDTKAALGDIIDAHTAPSNLKGGIIRKSGRVGTETMNYASDM